MTAREHAAVHEETKRRRNAHARALRFTRKEAERWCAHFGARTGVSEQGGGWLHVIWLTGFHQVADERFERAVATLARTVSRWCHSPAGESPTRAMMRPIREKQAAWEAG